MRKIGRVDANQKLIVSTLRTCGVSVLINSQTGNGAPDLILGMNGLNILAECKDGSKPPSQRCLTKMQEHFHANWRGQICIIQSIEDALKIVQAMMQGKMELGNVS